MTTPNTAAAAFEEALAERLWNAGLQPVTAGTAAKALAASPDGVAGWAPHTLAPGVVLWVHTGRTT